MKWILRLMFVVGIAGLVYSYGYMKTHAYLSIYFIDTSSLQSHRISDATFLFFDAQQKFLGKGRTDENGVFRVLHPEVGDCHEIEKKAPFSATAQKEWRACNAQILRWVSTWADQIRYADITAERCRFEKTKVFFQKYEAAWWRALIPLPHIGGVSTTYYDATIRVQLDGCKVIYAS